MNYRVSKTQGSSKINKLRTDESDFFKVMDYHIAMNKDTGMISAYSMNSYEISRMGDQLIRARNSLNKRDWRKFKEQIKNIPWIEIFQNSHQKSKNTLSEISTLFVFQGF